MQLETYAGFGVTTSASQRGQNSNSTREHLPCAAGPHFCLAGAMQFRIRDIVVPQQSAVAFLKDVISSKGQAPPTGMMLSCLYCEACGATKSQRHSNLDGWRSIYEQT